jgi:lipopolysaccharide transport system permease protein
MSVVYADPHFDVAPERRTVTARFRLADAGAGAIGWQVYDPETSTFISEGKWQPAIDGEMSVAVELPPARGRYHVYVSPVDEEQGWSYARGRNFVLIDATVEQGRAQLNSAGVTSLGALRRRRSGDSLRRFFTLPLRSIADNTGLIRSMVRRDILARYRGSFGDVFWAILNPLLLMATYYFVFGVVLRTRFGADTSRSGFVLYFLAGMMPWLAFSEAVGRSPHVILEYRNFVKKLVFPVETLPVNLMISGLVTEVFALLIFLVFLLGARGGIPATALWIPVILVPQVLFTAGLCWLLSSTGVFLRDLGQVMGFLLTLWFFLTPICYPETALPPGAAAILTRNPIYILVRAYRSVLLESHAPDWTALGALTAVSLAMFFLGHAWFYKLRKTFADVI